MIHKCSYDLIFKDKKPLSFLKNLGLYSNLITGQKMAVISSMGYSKKLLYCLLITEKIQVQ